jgi:hypothetical protein
MIVLSNLVSLVSLLLNYFYLLMVSSYNRPKKYKFSDVFTKLHNDSFRFVSLFKGHLFIYTSDNESACE